MRRNASTRLALPCLALLAGAACQGRSTDIPTPRPPVDGTDRTPGVSDFLSADTTGGQTNRRDPSPPSGDASEGEGENDGAAPGEDDGNRTVEEGDIYRVLGDGLIANLNPYRGLQLIDVSNVDEPTIVGRLQISGAPVEMYVDGSRVFILLNNWYGYYGLRNEISPLTQRNGGVVAAVDISDVSNPTLIDQAFVPGSIAKSRLTKGNVSRALYVVASDYGHVDSGDAVSSGGARTVVKSFDVSDGSIVERTELDLGGYVTDIQATNRALLVARHDWSFDDNGQERGSRVAVIDISSPDGEMVEGDEVQVAGYIQNQFRMHLEGDILRVASGSLWGATTTNHIETFQASNLGDITPVHHVTYGDGEQLFATLFLADRAFAVTYLRVDPFHAFSITADGFITEESEFVVSGWNDFFKPTLDNTRLLGVGTNDEVGSTMSVSLYDITDLTNANPLVARADVDTVYSWSNASWDHRAFSVIEGAVNVTGPQGEAETGLVLLPFSGYSDVTGRYSAAVQIFTYSAQSLTRRGVMDHGTSVNRSFNASEGLTANLSDAELSLFGTNNPDTPEAHGRLELAPNSTDLLVFGDHGARVNRKADYYWGWYDAAQGMPDSVVEIIPLSGDPDSARAVAQLEVPADAALYAAGETLVAITSRVVDWNTSPPVVESHLQAWDLTDPTVPVSVGELTTDRIGSAGSWYGGYDCLDCGRYGSAGSYEAIAVRDGIAFLQRTPQQELLERVQECYTYAAESSVCDETGNSCTYIGGGISCSQSEGGLQLCSGGFQRCTNSYDPETGVSDSTCEDVDAEDIETETNCWQNDRYRYWVSFSVEIVDLRGEPRLLDGIALDDADEGVGMVADGDRLWLSTMRPAVVPGSALPFVRYFARSVDLGDLDAIRVGTEINVPGALVAASGSTLFTRDHLWVDDRIETSVNRLRVEDDRAFLQASHGFERDIVQQVVLDGAGHALVTHQLDWQFMTNEQDYATRLSVLDAVGDMSPRSTTVVDSWAQLRDARDGRALFQVPGGLLVLNVADAAEPVAQAYFALQGWPTRIIVEGSRAIVPAGRFGVYSFDLDEFNLLAPEQ